MFFKISRRKKIGLIKKKKKRKEDKIKTRIFSSFSARVRVDELSS